MPGNKKYLTVVSFVLCFAVSSFAAPKWTTAKVDAAIQSRDFAKIFSAYECFTDKKEKGVDEAVEAFFSADREGTVAEIKKAAVAGSAYTEAMRYGAMQAAEYLKAEECLAELEIYLLAEKLWYPRSACAAAIDTIDNPSSAPAVVAALEKEGDASVMTDLGRYLSRHPVPGTRPLLEKKMAECQKLQAKDSSAFLAKGTLARALAALGESGE
jgi:hypothetical protein